MFRLACVLLLLLTYQLVSQAKIAPSVITREDPSSSGDCRTQRTLHNIIWGCVSTTIICAWAAIHPNIPPREGPVKGTLRRLELMFWTIVAPEILPAWALNQLLAAKTVRDVYNEGKGYTKERCGIWKTVKGWFSWYEITAAASQGGYLSGIYGYGVLRDLPVWTLKHGHFTIMGGIHLVEPPDDGSTRSTEGTAGTQRAASDAVDVPQTSAPLVEATNTDTEKGPSEKKPEPEPEQGRVTILTLEMLRELVKDPEFKIRITEEEITHRSMGDALSKIIFVLQSTWFILQCLGRRVQGLNLTHLELTTLALASLNGITFLLWWDKPLGAQTLVRVQMRRKLTDAERNVAGRYSSPSRRSGLIDDFQEFFESSVTGIRDIIQCRSEGNIIFDWPIRLPYFILVLLLSPILFFAFALFCTIVDLALGKSTSFLAGATHVPTFYVPNHRYSEWFHSFLLMTLGTTFGGIHCAGWNLPFPTYAEQKLWRVASLAVTIIPIAAFPLAVIVYAFTSLLLTIFKSSSNFSQTLSSLAFAFSMFAYMSARLVLLGQALALLRHLPPRAFIAVDWTKFYPHIL